MLLYREKLLSNGQLKRLSEHLYNCENIGLLDKYLQPFWNFLTSKTPLWLAPNVITVSGLLVNIITTLILVWHSPDARAEAPRWACLLCAVGLFMYQSLDAIDGKQARRTGTSNPLGELFDHGCDSVSTVFVALSACIAVQLGQYPNWMFFQCFCAMTLFYCAHWQTYVSGTMKFGRVDVTEAQCTIILIHLISAAFGPSIWMTEVDFIVKWELRYIIALVTIICCSVNLYWVFTVIISGGVGKNGSTVAKDDGLMKRMKDEMKDDEEDSKMMVLLSVLTIPFLPGCKYFHLVVYTVTLGFLASFSFFWKNFEAGGAGKNGSTVAVMPGVVGWRKGWKAWEGEGEGAETSLTGFFFLFLLMLLLAMHSGYKKVAVLHVECKVIVIVFTVVVFASLAYCKCRVIVGGGVGKNGSTVAGTSVLSPIIPFSLVIVPAYIIYKKSDNQLYENNPALYIMAFGMVSAKVTNRLVVAHMTKNELDYLDSALIGPAMLFLNQYFNFFFNEYYVLWACMIWVTFDLLRYSIEVCHEICDHLKIELFRIPYPNVAVTGKAILTNRSPPSNGQHQHQQQSEEEEELIRFEDARKSGRLL